MPPSWIPVLPLAPPWFTVQAVSPITTLTRSNGTSSSSATIWDRDIDPLAHVHLAEIGDDIAVGLDGEPAVEPIRLERRLYGAIDFGGGAGDADRDDERTGAFEEAAAVDRLGLPPLRVSRGPYRSSHWKIRPLRSATIIAL
jgi:hypothetical protein